MRISTIPEAVTITVTASKEYYSLKVKEQQNKSFKLKILPPQGVNIQNLESLILAQDERWRRA